MDNNRRRIPSQSSSYGGSGSSSRGGSSPAIGDFIPGGTYNQDKNSQFYNASSSRPLAPPPGFTLQQSGMNDFLFQQLQNVPQNSSLCYQNFLPFGSQPQHDNFGIPANNVGHNNYYPQNPMPRRESQQDFSTASVLGQHQYNSDVRSNGCELDKGINMLLNAGNAHHSNTVSNGGYNFQKPQGVESVNGNGGIKPIIDNIVGSMNMSNGTYTHFGPATATYTSTPGNVPQYFRSEPSEQNILENIVAPRACYANDKRASERTVGSNADIIANTSNARSSTPNDVVDNESRPQTPGKPSYSEILAKCASQNGSTPNVTNVRKVASPSPNNISSVGDSYQSTQPQGHRKSFDYVHMSSNSSAASSSCASASSSPVVKQKLISQSIVGRLFSSNKGKENSVEHLSLKPSLSYTRSTPSTTPTHQKKNSTQYVRGDSNENGRKILSSSQDSAKTKSSSSKSASTKVYSGQSSFDFEIEDLNDDSDLGWKTYTSRNRSNLNRSNSGNTSGMNKESKRSSIGNCGIVTIGLENTSKNEKENNNDNYEDSENSRRESLIEKKLTNSQSPGIPTPSTFASTTSTVSGTGSAQRKTREKDKPKSRRDGRNCTIRKLERMVYLWATHLISAASWLFKLVTDVITLSISVGFTLVENMISWWKNKAVPACVHQFQGLEDGTKSCLRKLKQWLTSWRLPFRRKVTPAESEEKKNAQDLLAALGPERNIALPSNGDDALKRLLSVKGQDPYSILGVRSDSSDETVRRYYKKQAVLVHPDKNLVLGAEEAFKILARAFELIGEPAKRQEYHRKLIEAHAKEQVYGEIGKLLEQLRKKMEIASSSIRCTKCNSRHKKNKTDRPLFAARYCAQCEIHHAAREGELWAEKKGWLWSWNYFACMDCHIWEINEWAKCQKKNLLHIKPNSHCVMYRLIAGNGNNQQGQQQGSNGNVGGHAADSHLHTEHEDDWNSLINNLCKSTGGVPGGKSGNHFYQQGKGGSTCCTGGMPTSSSASASGRKRKGKRK